MKSKFEKKSLFNKIVAMVCTIALLLSMSMPYTAWAAAKDVTSIKLIYAESYAEDVDTWGLGISGQGDLYDEDTYTLGKISVTANESSDEDGNIVWTLTPDGGNFNTVNSFDLLIYASYLPQITTNANTTINSTPKGDGETYTATISLRSIKISEYELRIGPAPAPEYSVDFDVNDDEDNYSFTDITVGNKELDLNEAPFSVTEGETLKFKVEPKFGYKISNVYNNGARIKSDADGFYSVIVNADAYITVATSNAQYTISGLIAPDEGYKIIGDSITNGRTTVEHGKNYTFTLVTPEGTQTPDVQVSGGAEVDFYNGQWIISNITQDVTVKITPGASKKYDVTMPDERIGYTILNNAASVAHGETYTFDIKLDKNYNQSAPKVTATNGSVALTNNGDGTYTCTLTGITENTTVSVSGITRNPYVISGLTEGEGYTITASSAISEGKVTTKNDSYTFYVKAADGYGNPNVSIEGGEAVLANPSEGTYIINSITDDVIVTIERGSKKKYNVRFTNGTGYQFDKTAATIEHETGTLSFSVVLDSAYDQSANNIKLNITSGNGTIQDNGNLKYTITGVTEDTTITVDSRSIELNTYTISGLNSLEGAYTVQGTIDENGTAQVKHGSSYSFYVNTVNGRKEPTVTASNGKNCIKNGNQYTIENVTGDISVTISAGEEIKYDVTLNKAEGCDFVNTSGDVISSDSVKYGQDFEFKLKASQGYDISGAVVQVDGKNITPDENGVYTISNITANTIVSVSGVTKIVYKVTMNQVEGATITASGLSVSYGDDFYFTVSVNVGYELAEIKVNGKKIDDAQVGMNTITGVTSDLEISVAVKKITYKVTVNEGKFTTDGLDNTVVYGGSVSFKVSPDDYNKITRVIVNGTEYFADNTGTYTVSNVTNDLAINVMTTPVTITINYLGGKWADNKTVTYTYDGKSAIDEKDLEVFVSNEILYVFDGWIMNDGDLDFDAKADKSVTLNAHWVDNRQYIRANIVLTTQHQAGSQGNITVRTNIDVSKLKYNTEFQGAQVLAYGTLLSMTPVDNNDIYLLKDKVLNGNKLAGNEDGTGLQLERFKDSKNNTIVNYYHTDYIFDPLEMSPNNNYIRLGIKGFAEGTLSSYSALGWIKLQIGEETVIVFSDAWDCDFSK